MRFGQFFKEVCQALRNEFDWVGAETIMTQKIQCLDIVHTQYGLALNDVQQANISGSGEELMRQRVFTTAVELNQLKALS